MLRPETENDLSEAIRAANGPLSVCGGNTRGIVPEGKMLSAAAMSGITLYEPGALTLVARAGTPVAQIDDALAAEGQRLAFEPMDHRELLGTEGTPTIGGVVAANVSGPRRIQGGAARDYALGVRFVDGSGTILKNGGRVMKNVTGYDLVKLLAGSFGTLGVLTEVALKVLPVPETSGTLVVHGLDDASAIDAMSRAMGSPFEVTGAAYGAGISGDAALCVLRVEGFESSVAYRLEQLKTLLAPMSGDLENLAASASEALWQKLRNVGPFAGAEGDIWRISCVPSAAPGLVAAAAATRHYYDWAGGLIWVNTPSGTDLRARLGAFDGHATLVRGDRAQGVFHPQATGLEKLSAGLRAKFDPRGILNKGLMSPAQGEMA